MPTAIPDTILREAFAFLPADAKTITSVRLTSPDWATAADQVELLQANEVSESAVFIHAPSSQDQEENTAITVKDVKSEKQLAAIRQYLNSVTDRFQAHNTFLELTIEVTTAELYLAACTFLPAYAGVEVGLEAKSNFINAAFLTTIPDGTTVTRFDFATGQASEALTLTDADILQFSSRFPKTVGFNLCGHTQLTSDGIQKLCRQNGNSATLKYLALSRIANVDKDALDAVGAIDGLVALELDGCDKVDDDAIEYLIYGKQACVDGTIPLYVPLSDEELMRDAVVDTEDA